MMTDGEKAKFRETMIGMAAQDPDIEWMIEATKENFANDDTEADITATFAKLAGPKLTQFGLREREDADAVIVQYLSQKEISTDG